VVSGRSIALGPARGFQALVPSFANLAVDCGRSRSFRLPLSRPPSQRRRSGPIVGEERPATVGAARWHGPRRTTSMDDKNRTCCATAAACDFGEWGEDVRAHVSHAARTLDVFRLVTPDRLPRRLACRQRAAMGRVPARAATDPGDGRRLLVRLGELRELVKVRDRAARHLGLVAYVARGGGRSAADVGRHRGRSAARRGWVHTIGGGSLTKESLA